jgi:hypothetical protein
MRGTYLYPGNLSEFQAQAGRAGIELEPPGSGRGEPHGYADDADTTWLFRARVPPGDTRPCDFDLAYDFALTRFRDTLLVELRAVRGGCGFDEDQTREAARFFNRGVARPLGLQPARRVEGYPRTDAAIENPR